MKRKLLFQLIPGLLVLSLILGCGRSGKQPQPSLTEGKNVALPAEAPDSAKMKAQLIELIQKVPDGVVIADFLIEAGASYIHELTVPTAAIEKMLTTTQKAFGAGMIAFDSKYASVFNRGDMVIKSRKELNRLNTELGLAEGLGLAEKFAGRFERNKSNIDSLKILTDLMVNNYRQYILKGEHALIYSRQFIAVNIEALYVLSKLTLLASHREKLLRVMNNQNERVKTLASVLEIISADESIRPCYESIAPILKYLGERVTITEQDLVTLVPMIEKARISILP